jgi:lysozyme family protein
LAVVFAAEGGYTNNPADPGGPTNFGITLADLKAWRNDPNLTAVDVQNMTKAEAQEIYRSKYWNPIQGNDLPNGIDLITFDFGVNAGVRTSVKLLQTCLGVTADGSIGPITVAASKAADPRGVIQSFTTRKMDYYRSLPTWPTFGAGWTNRANTVEDSALKMLAPAALVA